MNMRNKLTSVLKSNLRILPAAIAEYERKGKHHNAAMSKRVLAESRAELARRGING